MLNSSKMTKISLESFILTGIQIDSVKILMGKKDVFRPFPAINIWNQYVRGFNGKMTYNWSVNVLSTDLLILHPIQPIFFYIVLRFL